MKTERFIKEVELPKNVTAFTDRHGKRRYRFRKTGSTTYNFKSVPGTSEFEMEAANCLVGVALPKGMECVKLPEGSFVYFIGSGGRAVKIGTTINLSKRLSALSTSSPMELELLAYMPGGPVLEAALHKMFAMSRMRGEWFSINPQPQALIDELAHLLKVHQFSGLKITQTQLVT